MHSKPNLVIRNLQKYYKRFPALGGVSFEVMPGEILALLGPNGAGKTTTLRCISGLLQPSAGEIFVCDVDVLRDPLNAKRQLAYVPEVPAPYDLLTLREQLEFIARAYSLEDASPRIDEILERFDLTGKRNELCVNLSKGMKQKVALATAFIRDPGLILLDEPLIGIDPKAARELKDLVLERAKSGTAFVVSTHMLDTAERLASRMVILNRGVIIAEGSLEQLNALARVKEGATLEEIFLRLTHSELEPEEAEEISKILTPE